MKWNRQKQRTQTHCCHLNIIKILTTINYFPSRAGKLALSVSFVLSVYDFVPWPRPQLRHLLSLPRHKFVTDRPVFPTRHWPKAPRRSGVMERKKRENRATIFLCRLYSSLFVNISLSQLMNIYFLNMVNLYHRLLIFYFIFFSNMLRSKNW